MSFMGSAFDSVIASVQAVVNIILSISVTLGQLVSAVFTIIGEIISFLYSLYSVLEIVSYAFLHLELVGLLFMGCGFYFAVFMAKSRKELLVYTGKYYFSLFSELAKLMSFLYTIIVRLVVGIINII